MERNEESIGDTTKGMSKRKSRGVAASGKGTPETHGLEMSDPTLIA